MIRILNICGSDYANVQNNVSEALRQNNCEVVDMKLQPHKFNYSKQSPIRTLQQMREEISSKDYDIIQFIHGEHNFIPLVELAALKPNTITTVWHTGTEYRMNSEKMNIFFNPLVDLTFTDQTEFMKLGAKNINFVVPPVPDELFEKRNKRNK